MRMVKKNVGHMAQCIAHSVLRPIFVLLPAFPTNTIKLNSAAVHTVALRTLKKRTRSLLRGDFALALLLQMEQGKPALLRLSADINVDERNTLVRNRPVEQQLSATYRPKNS